MQNEKNKKPKKTNEILKSIHHVVYHAKKGSKAHIAILAGGVVLFALIVGLAIWGITSMVGGGGGDVGPDIADTVEIDPEADNKYNKDEDAIDVEKLSKTVLAKTEDAGKTYVDETVFVGDSNTVRTMFYGHTTWNNVVGAVSMGIQQVTTTGISSFAGMPNLVDVPTSIKILQPKRIIVTYGTNNTIGWSDKKFIDEYKKALKAIKAAYPSVDIIVNAVPPIDKQRENLKITMQTIDGFNKALAEMCDSEGYKFLNSAEALKDEKTGFAKTDYTISDGVHLSQKGMDALFEYVKTHAYITEDDRPKLTYIPKRTEKEAFIIGSDPLAVRGGMLNVTFVSNDFELGSVDGEAAQRVKRTQTTAGVVAKAKAENGGVFTGWTAEYEGISDKGSDSITYTVPQLSEEITDVKITANFKKVGLTMSKTSATLEKNGVVNLTASVDDSGFTGDKTVSWSSTNPSVATVDANGRVVGVGNGQATIKASILGGKIETTCTVSVSVTLKSISITAKDDKKEMATKTTLQLTAVANPAGSPLGTVTWSSSNTEVATVSASGLVTATEKGGAVTITAKVGELAATYNIKVSAPNPITGVTLTPGSAELFVGATLQLVGAVSPTDTNESKEVTYTSSSDAIATVNAAGLVTAGATPGTATITCKSKANPEKFATMTVTVKAKPADIVATGITLNKTSTTLLVGGSETLTATVSPSNATNKVVTWSSSNTGMVSVSAGTITGIGVGTATITAMINGISVTCAVTVNAVPEVPEICGANGCSLVKGHTEVHNSPCTTPGCTLPFEHGGSHTPTACTETGCTLTGGHEGPHNNQTPPPDTSSCTGEDSCAAPAHKEGCLGKVST